MYDEALDSVTLKVWVVCKQCAAPYAHPRSEGQGTGTILKHKRVHERDNEKAAQKVGKTPDIRTLLENPPPKARLTQEEYDVKCLNAMMACNWSFEQFSDVSFWYFLSCLTIRYNHDHLLPLSVTPGRRAPPDLDSFLFPLIKELQQLRNGVPAYDSHTQSSFLLKAHLVLTTGDTPAISKIYHLSGHNAIYPCRLCVIKGFPYQIPYKTSEEQNGERVEILRLKLNTTTHLRRLFFLTAIPVSEIVDVCMIMSTESLFEHTKDTCKMAEPV